MKSAKSSPPVHVNSLLPLCDEEFIYATYAATLGRMPDKDGLACYLTMLRSGAPKIEIIGRLRNSPEGKARAPRIVGLWLPYMLNCISRIPVLGRIFLIAGEIWNLPSTKRAFRGIMNDRAKVAKEIEQNFNLIFDALYLSPEASPAKFRSGEGRPPFNSNRRGRAGTVGEKMSHPSFLKDASWPLHALDPMPSLVQAIEAVANRFGERIAMEFAYVHILGRRADPLGLEDKCQALATGQSSIEDICMQMLTSEEYRRRPPIRHRDPLQTIESWAKVGEA